MKTVSPFNSTSLREAHHGKTVHRDYLAHACRWSFALKYVKTGDIVVDLGCGPDGAFEKVLVNFPHPPIPKQLTAIDVDKFPIPVDRPWIDWKLGEDALSYLPADFGPVDLLVCFEVLEHMSESHARRMLMWIHEVLAPNGLAMVSTPVYDKVHQAKNHLKEWQVDELWDAMESAGLYVEKRFGTFMNVHQVPELLTAQWPGGADVFAELSEYYSNETMAVLFAPLFPDESRNNVWKIRRAK